MLYKVIRRIASSGITILLAAFLCFLLLRVMPGDPARVILGPLAPVSSVTALRHDMGLNRPLPEQFWIYVRDFFTGAWGYSYTNGLPVRSLIADRIMATVELGLFAFLLAFVAAVALALSATYRRRPTVDRLARALSFVAIGTPPFWLGLVGLIFGFQHWHIFPGPEGRLAPSAVPPHTITGLYTVDSLLTGNLNDFGDALWHLLLPGLVLALAPFGFLFRLLRTSLLETRGEAFLTVVRSKGVRRWAAFVRHALPNAFLPTLTASALILADLLAGSVLVETIFVWPGVGQLVVTSIQRADYSVVQAFILMAAVGYVVINMLVDLLYGLIDPRARIKAEATR